MSRPRQSAGGLRRRIVSFACLVLSSITIVFPTGKADAAQRSKAELRFSNPPADRELFASGIFAEPLVPIGSTTSEENAALAAALLEYRKATAPDDVAPITRFIASHPRSAWSAALFFNLGAIYRHTGHFSKALDAWRRAWELSKAATEPKAKALADRAVGELAEFQAYLGRGEELEPLLEAVRGRELRGAATELITNASDGLALMRERPGEAFRCGPLALQRIAAIGDASPGRHSILEAARSTARGTSLTQVRDLSVEAGMNFQMAHRQAGAELVVPSVAHWKVGHFAAISRKIGDRYVVEDPTFGDDIVVSAAALDEESSGYFLVPPGALPKGWQAVSTEQGNEIWGRGTTSTNDPAATGRDDVKSKPEPECKESTGLTTYNFHAMLVGLTLHDTPVGYKPPLGPPVEFEMFYSQRDSSQPANFTYTNFGPKWTSNWVSYVVDNGASATVYGRGGGLETYTFPSGSSVSDPGPFSQAQLTKLTTGSMTTGFIRQLPDGSVEAFEQPLLAMSGTKFFLTGVADPAGNSVTLAYDMPMMLLRLVSLTDALGKVTTLSYELATDPLKVTKVTDPFGRSASFTYASGLLTSITDTLGLVSAYAYGPGDFVNALTTPYGTTTFTSGDSAGPGGNTTRYVTATDPLGQTERTEFRHDAPGIASSDPVVPSINFTNSYLNKRNTFVWDKHALPIATAGGGLDYTKARILHWLHAKENFPNVTSRVLESVKEPLENRVWFRYPGQTDSIRTGTSNRPTEVARVLDDGTKQFWALQYNDFGKVTKTTDPIGRERTLTYDANGIDLISVDNTTAGANQRLFTATYNALHEPTRLTDASGEETLLAYNSRGQLTRLTDSFNKQTTLEYTNSLLTKVTRPLGSTTTFTYDGLDRLRSTTDPLGYTLTYDYDAADRVLQVTYPDTSSEQRSYRFLDLASFTDRLGRTTSYAHDAIRQLIEIEDPLGRATKLAYCDCGSVSAITDGRDNTTTFDHDLQGRVVRKQFADGSGVDITYESKTPRVQSKTDALGQKTQFSYNIDDTLSGITYVDAVHPTPGVSFTWDPAFERVLTMSDGTGVTTFTYNPVLTPPQLGATRLASITGPVAGDVITFGYDAMGRVTSRTVAGASATWSFDDLGRMSSTTNALGTFAADYLGASGLVSQLSGTPLTRAFTYFDNVGNRLLQTISNTLNGQPLSEIGYAYNAAEQVIERTEPLASRVDDFSYDDASQLIAATRQNSTPASYSYAYDFAGNRTAETIDGQGTSSTYDALNQISSGGATYDANGNPLALDGMTFEWDAADRMITAIKGTLRWEFQYDGFGRRTRITKKHGTNLNSDNLYLWCGGELCQERDARLANVVSKRYFPQGVESNGVALFYTTDALGSVREVVDSARVVRASYRYDPYGRRTKVSGDLDVDFGFAGLFRVASSNLDLATFRAYDANIGRWLNRDPIGELGSVATSVLEEIGRGGSVRPMARAMGLSAIGVNRKGPIGFTGADVNLYGYVLNDPINGIDPAGLTEIDITVAATLAQQLNPDLRLPSTIDPSLSENLGQYNWLTDTMKLNKDYLDPLSDTQAAGLLDTVIHEMLHKRDPLSKQLADSFRDHPDVDEEAGIRAGAINDEYQRKRKEAAEKKRCP